MMFINFNLIVTVMEVSIVYIQVENLDLKNQLISMKKTAETNQANALHTAKR